MFGQVGINRLNLYMTVSYVDILSAVKIQVRPRQKCRAKSGIQLSDSLKCFFKKKKQQTGKNSIQRINAMYKSSFRVVNTNPSMPNGSSQHYQLDESISNLRVVG